MATLSLTPQTITKSQVPGLVRFSSRLETSNGDLVSSRPVSLDQHPVALYLAGLSTSSGRVSMACTLEKIAGILSQGRADALNVDWSKVRFQHATALRTRLLDQGHKPATVNKYLSALRGVLKASWQLGQMTAEDYHKAVSVKGVKGQSLPAGRELSPGELRSLLGGCAEDPSPSGARDAAILALLYGGGLRRAELVTLDSSDYDPDSGRLVVQGKGHKERIVWCSNGSKDALDDWLIVRGSADGPLFFRIQKGGQILTGRLTTQAVYYITQQRARKSGVRSFSPHDMRRTFVSDLLEAGADLSTVSRMAGHANVQTTARYDRRSEETKKKAAQLLFVPYQRCRSEAGITS